LVYGRYNDYFKHFDNWYFNPIISEEQYIKNIIDNNIQKRELLQIVNYFNNLNITEKETIYKTRYLFANNSCNQRMIWSNDKKFLHDPKRFDINPKNQKEGE